MNLSIFSVNSTYGGNGQGMGSATTDNEWLKKDTGKEQKMTKKMTKKWRKNDLKMIKKRREKSQLKLLQKWLKNDWFLVNNREIFSTYGGNGLSDKR